MKKLKIFAFLVGVALVLTGCGSKIELPTALENNTKINSYAYNFSMEASSDAFNEITKSYGVTSDKVKLELDGKTQKQDGRVKNYAEISASYGGLSIEVPTYMDFSETEFDFDLFVGIPAIIKNYIEEGKTNLYLSGAELKDYLKEIMDEEEYQKLNDSFNDIQNKDSVNKKLAEDVTKAFFDYIDKNSKEVQVFEKIEGLKTSANGIYTITLFKEDIKLMVTEFLNNTNYYNDLKAAIEKSDASIEEFPEAQELINSFNEAMDMVKDISLVLTFTIENKIVVGTNVDIKVIDLEDNVTNIIYHLEISDINKDMEITMPDKNAESTLNVMDYLKGFGLGF